MLVTKLRLAIALLALGIAAGGIALRSSASIESKPYPPLIDSRMNMPPDVAAIVSQSCADCHTHQTNKPWYGKLPPVSWMIERDVRGAQRAMDLTNWSTRNGRTRGGAIGTLTAACADITSGRMPPKRYVWMHPGAKPSQDDTQRLCEWTRAAIHGGSEGK